ncbi:hypothetical protein NRIC_15080 [Enterococcus florum]|uniref:Uncharacterized protein n=1 Tax=Enterococcus florum TaxID=2480627 RepID=A0A4P5P6R6_9ENTE|nr:hypothetical protein [Enterococcus florum]GCF93617.1 hypothetical protein NRIC_15080 [Enterococcus florum]
MKEEEIELGKIYRCHPIGFEAAIEGEVVSKMANCAVLRVNSCQEVDEEQKDDKSNMVVAKYSSFIS